MAGPRGCNANVYWAGDMRQARPICVQPIEWVTGVTLRCGPNAKGIKITAETARRLKLGKGSLKDAMLLWVFGSSKTEPRRQTHVPLHQSRPIAG
jgi:hypothetical protein